MRNYSFKLIISIPSSTAFQRPLLTFSMNDIIQLLGNDLQGFSYPREQKTGSMCDLWNKQLVQVIVIPSGFPPFSQSADLDLG